MKKENCNYVYCNGAKSPSRKKTGINNINLEYDKSFNSSVNVKIKLPSFVNSVSHLSPKIKDLLEIASYVYAADRKFRRGTRDNVEYQSWDRNFNFFIKVRDFNFWNDAKVKNALSEALCFMTGDNQYNFNFQKGRDDFPTNLFDDEKFTISQPNDSKIILFSGGLDSLAGIIESLSISKSELFLVSHSSGQPRTHKTQKSIIQSLEKDFPNRCKYYKFTCSLINERPPEETQRSRSFLFSSIAFAIATANAQNEFYFYENGITSLNLSNRQDLINSRASRTTHPKTIRLLENFFNLFNTEKQFFIKHPYFSKTKSDIVSVFKKYEKQNYIDSTVSCGKTSFNGIATHCGGCSQCIDRRFAMYSNGCEEFDGTGIYNIDFIKEDVSQGLVESSIVDFIRLAVEFEKMNENYFYNKYLSELTDTIDFVEGNDEEEKVIFLCNLFKRHGKQIEIALERIRNKFDKPFLDIQSKSSILKILRSKHYLKIPEIELADKLIDFLNDPVRMMFSNNKPKNENDFNDKVEALLQPQYEKYQNEFPTVKFSFAKTTPDHSIDIDFWIESKYIRNGTTPSVVTEGISADLTKYHNAKYVLFIVYDPFSNIDDENEFKKDFEDTHPCKIHIIR